MEIEKFSILVNSTDSYEDCWYPFFKLFSKFWPNCHNRIFLNTERKEFSYPGLNIVCSKIASKDSDRVMAWGEELLLCLDKIGTDVILYLHDDYFINAAVDVGQIDDFVNFMISNKISCIGLLQSGRKLSQPTNHSLLWSIDQKDKYRLSLQASLWRKDRLRFYTNRLWTPWQFEILGSRRAHHIKDTILCVNEADSNAQGRNPVLPYHPLTGIVKGKWCREAVEDLFRINGIDMHFSGRGFYDPACKASNSITFGRFIQKIIARLPF